MSVALLLPWCVVTMGKGPDMDSLEGWFYWQKT